MKVGIMQPYFFPYLGYWQLLNAVDQYVIYDDVNYIKNGWINRNNILLNGKKFLITLPLEGASPFLPINQIKITSNEKQKQKILKTIDSAYRSAPYFDAVYPIVETVIMCPSLSIAEALTLQFQRVASYLGINTEFIISSALNKDSSLKGQDKVIHICNKLGATKYYNAIGGQELYSKDVFLQHHIELSFLKMNDINYRQFKHEFVPSLSIIDVMMFNSPENIHSMLDNYELIS